VGCKLRLQLGDSPVHSRLVHDLDPRPRRGIEPKQLGATFHHLEQSVDGGEHGRVVAERLAVGAVHHPTHLHDVVLALQNRPCSAGQVVQPQGLQDDEFLRALADHLGQRPRDRPTGTAAIAEPQPVRDLLQRGPAGAQPARLSVPASGVDTADKPTRPVANVAGVVVAMGGHGRPLLLSMRSAASMGSP
jgi:hypothetical protein